jgi:plastocyanin
MIQREARVKRLVAFVILGIALAACASPTAQPATPINAPGSTAGAPSTDTPIPVLPTATTAPTPSLTSAATASNTLAPTNAPTQAAVIDATATNTVLPTLAPTRRPSNTPLPQPAVVQINAGCSNNVCAFQPTKITVKKGTTIVWKSLNEKHEIVTDDWEGPGGPNTIRGGKEWQFDTGQQVQFTFQAPGVVSYFCGFHGKSMNGVITVTE